MSLTQYFHILNPSKKSRAGVLGFFKKQSHLRHIVVDRDSHPTHAETIVEWALQEGEDKLAVWGGDGTFNRVINRLVQLNALKKVSVALLPAGTCNDFSRKLKLGNWKRFSKVLMGDRTDVRSYDLGVLEAGKTKRVFLNNAGFGRTQEALQRKKSNPLKDIQDFTEKRLHVEWNNQKLQQFETFRAIIGMVFNAPFFNCGMHFSKRVEPDDGLLDFYLVPPQGRVRLLGKFIKSRLGGSLMDKTTQRLEANRINIQSDSLLYPQVDGEPFSNDGGVQSLTFSVMKGALNLLIPQE